VTASTDRDINILIFFPSRPKFPHLLTLPSQLHGFGIFGPNADINGKIASLALTLDLSRSSELDSLRFVSRFGLRGPLPRPLASITFTAFAERFVLDFFWFGLD